MKTGLVLRRSAAFLVLAGAAPVSLAAQPGPPKTEAPAPDSLNKNPTLITTFSGGISLGAYQAGVDWALLEFYRAANRDAAFARRWRLPRFSFGTAAGASAGNINALLWAIETCTRQNGGQPPAQSLFWKVWTNIDVEHLLPAHPRDSAELALLDRGFIDSLYDTITVRTRSGALDPRCVRPVGITLTRVIPETMRLAGGIPFRSQRYVVPLLATVETGSDGRETGPAERRMVFSRPDIDDHRLGPVRHPLRAPEGNVPLDRIYPVVKASSAFPVAFQPVTLELERGDTSAARPEMFVDGGLFDNNPVDLALVLHRAVKLAPDSVSGPSARYQLLYVDPDNPRPGAAAAGCPIPSLGKPSRCAPRPPREPLPGGMRPVLSLLGGAFNSAREYELFALSRSLPRDTISWQLLTTRYHPVVGERLASFGAFLNRAYREHDFYVGAYDAIHFVLCESPGRNLQPRRDEALCTYENARALRDALPLPGAASQLIGRLARAEFEPDTGGAVQRIQRLRAGPRDTVRLAPGEEAAAAVYASIADALEHANVEGEVATSAECGSSLSWSVACLDGTHRFLALLRARLLKVDPSACGHAARPRDAEAAAMLAHYELCELLRQPEDEYFQVYFDRVMRRLVQVERDVDAGMASRRDTTGGKGMQRATEGVAFLYQSTSLRPHVGWHWGGMPAEVRTPWRWAPAYATVDAQWDGADLGWEPVLYSRGRPGTGVAFPVGVRWNNPVASEEVPHWYYMAGAKVVVRNRGAWSSLLGTRAEAGLLLFQPSRDLWEGRLRGTLAYELTATVLADRLRVGMRTSLIGEPVDGHSRTQFSLGLNDTNGLGYWLTEIFSR